MKTISRFHIKTSLFLALGAVSMYGGLSLAQDSGIRREKKMSYQSNYVNLSMETEGYKLLGGTYETTEASWTPGQDPEWKNMPPESYDIQGSDGAIGFSIGRKASEGVANWFNNMLGPHGNTYGESPSEMNFAFAGTLTLSIQGPGMDPEKPVVLPNIFLGQNRNGTGNTWWFGGLGCTRVAGDADEVICQSANYPSMAFSFVRGNDYDGHSNANNEVYVYITPK